MNFTRMRLNGRRRGSHKLLGSPEAMHAAMASAFPPGVEPGRILWRVDNRNDPSPTLYVVSGVTPDLTHVMEQAGWPGHPTVQTADYAPFLSKLAAGQEWAFALTANPTHRVGEKGGRVLGHVTVAQQLAWLLDRADRIGVELTDADGQPTATVIGRDVWRFRRGGNTVTLAVAAYSGRLRVADADLLRAALAGGVGRAKAYGCGLLTLAQP